MAAKMSIENLQNEVSCSICLDVFQDPVSIHCGHSFCRACIIKIWEGMTTNFSCPQCRETVPQKSLRPNWELASIIEAAKNLNLQRVREVEGGENLCKEHKEALKLFCEDEKMLICVVCDKSKVHRNHSVVPVDEAAQEYKEQIQTQLKRLKLEDEELRPFLEVINNRIQDFSKNTKAEKQNIVGQYTQLHKLLEVHKSLFLTLLEQLDTEITKAHDEVFTNLLEETTSLGTLIRDLERICQQPDCELLKDIKTTLSRCKRKTFSQPLDIPPELKKKFNDFTEKTAIIKEVAEKAQDIVEFELPLKTQVTLDPNTANAMVELVGISGATWWDMLYKQDVPSSPERFSFHPCVLGLRGFTSGWHRWEVEICEEGPWAIGVAKKSVPRKSSATLTTREGVWALCHIRSEYRALTVPRATTLTLPNDPQRIRIFLDYEGGRVVFFDAVRKSRIFAFQQASFQGETVYPWCLVKKKTYLNFC
ncbi:zinc finger protein RFP-like [Tyto alba]|uniref:zinc finger protein RFP-like n=1 Tax=Tyto alba TaxID=56313 RepID=UPI001C66C956|nr:zinc finger protein RFP-like [Tyto alba]